jgi:hypothetical protein
MCETANIALVVLVRVGVIRAGEELNINHHLLQTRVRIMVCGRMSTDCENVMTSLLLSPCLKYVPWHDLAMKTD